jgi:hypothetical protein
MNWLQVNARPRHCKYMTTASFVLTASLSCADVPAQAIATKALDALHVSQTERDQLVRLAFVPMHGRLWLCP